MRGKITTGFEKFRKDIISFVMSLCVCVSVCPTPENNSPPKIRILMKSDISVPFENLSENFKFCYDSNKGHFT